MNATDIAQFQQFCNHLVEIQNEWHKVHAALLKSVAEAQGKLLAGINDIDARLSNDLKLSDPEGIVADSIVREKAILRMVAAMTIKLDTWELRLGDLGRSLDALALRRSRATGRKKGRGKKKNVRKSS